MGYQNVPNDQAYKIRCLILTPEVILEDCETLKKKNAKKFSFLKKKFLNKFFSDYKPALFYSTRRALSIDIHI